MVPSQRTDASCQQAPRRGLAGEITPAQAAVALRNYLTHGEPRWAEAMTV